MLHVRNRMLGLAALLLLLMSPGLAWAGSWTVIVLDQTPEGVRAGTAFRIGFVVLQHGKQPVGGLEPRIDLINTEGQQISYTAMPEGPLGHYVADLTLPTAGTWRWSIETFGPVATLSPIEVADAVPAAGVARIPTGLSQNWAALIAALGLAGIATLLIVYRGRPAEAV